MSPSRKTLASLLAALGFSLAVGAPVAAETDPKFVFAKPDEPPKPGAPPPPAVEWKAQAKAGLNVTTGNSQTTNGTGGISVSRKQGNNKLALDGAIAYGKSNILTPVIDPAAPTTITDLRRTSVTATNNWFAKGRYDRFFTANNAGYATALTAADRIAGKTFMGGGQIGYRHRHHRQRRGVLQPQQGKQGDQRRQRHAGSRPIQGHARDRQARVLDHVVQEPERRGRVHAPLRPEPGAAPHPVGLAGRGRLRGIVHALRRTDGHDDRSNGHLHLSLATASEVEAHAAAFRFPSRRAAGR